MTSPYRSIVVGVDFAPSCAAAVRQALRFALWSGARVEGVHVVDTVVIAEIEQNLSPLQTSIREGLVHDARAAWAEFSAGIEGAPGVELSVVINNRVRGILARAEAARADLLVLGAFAHKAPDLGLGTVATACVRRCAAPVLLVRDTHTGPYRTVVACVDFSDTSLNAVRHAAAIAEQEQAELHLLHVFDAPWKHVHYRGPSQIADAGIQQHYRDGLLARLRAFCEQEVQHLSKARVRFEVFDHTGHRSALAEYARHSGADLLVLGTRGRSNLRDVLLGSTAEKLLREAPCSVLAVKPSADNPGD